MRRKKTAGKSRMPQLDFVDTPPLNTPWRPTTPSRSCLCPVTADVVNIDQLGCDWISPHFERLFATDNKQSRKKRHAAAVPLTSAANTSVRTTTSRRVFPPLQFVSDGARTARKPYNTRSRVSKNMQASDAVIHNDVTCLEPHCEDKVAESDVCSEYIDLEVQTETAENSLLAKRHRMTEIVAETSTSNVNNSDHEQTSCVPAPVQSEPVCCKVVDRPACCDQLTDVRTLGVYDKNLAVAEQSPRCVEHQNQDSTAYAENVSDVNFDINTPTCDVEPLDCSEMVNKGKTETVTCPNAFSHVEHHSSEPVHVLSFSRIDRSLDEMVDPVESEPVICAAVLKENMSELLDRDEETSGNASVAECRQLFCNEKTEFLTPDSFRNHHQDVVLVSDTPMSEYGLSYRQRALKAGNIRLRHRTRKS